MRIGSWPSRKRTLKQSNRRFLRAFTLIELLVVIAIIALLMSILMPALKFVRRQARAVVCMSQLHQWGVYFRLYTNDHGGYFYTSVYYPPTDGGPSNQVGYWFNAMRSYHSMRRKPPRPAGGYGRSHDYKLALCPSATKPVSEGGGGWFCAWGILSSGLDEHKIISYRDGDYGSYGINNWVSNPPPWIKDKVYAGNFEKEYFWRMSDVKGAYNIPLLLDSRYFAGNPRVTDSAPEYFGHTHGDGAMIRFCMDRHRGGTNGAFVDFSVRKIGIRQLYKLKWHRAYDIRLAPTGDAWPEWMRKFKSYD